MYRFFRSRYEPYNKTTYTVNPVRYVEFILCMTCLVLIVVMIAVPYAITFTVGIALMGISAAFGIITLADIITNTLYNPMYWNTWILFAMGGALFFFLCCGFLLAILSNIQIIFIIATIVNLVTAIIFLLDALLIVNLTRRKLNEIAPEAKPRDRSQDIVHETIKETRITTQKEIPTDTSSQSSFFRRNIECECGDNVRGPPSSYGGTFPMGRDAAPLPSPSPTPKSTRSSVSRKKPCCLKLCRSNTVTASSKVQTTQDGSTVLADGTPLVEERLESGDVGYRDHRGVIYTKSGIPIAPEKEEMVEMKMMQKNVSRNEVYYKDGNYYTQDGRKIPPVKLNCMGKVVGIDGKPLEEICLGEGNIVYQSPEGFLYSMDGTPYGYNAGYKQDRFQVCDGACNVQSVQPHSEVNTTEEQFTEDTQKQFLVPRRSVETFRSQEVIRTVEFHPYESPPLPPNNCQFFTHNNVPLIEVRTPSGTRMYQGPKGELYHADRRGIVFCRNQLEMAKDPRSLPDPATSRTVAVSTRMVPKGAKSKSEFQQTSTQYLARPCTCGKTHIQEVPPSSYRVTEVPQTVKPVGVYHVKGCPCNSKGKERSSSVTSGSHSPIRKSSTGVEERHLLMHNTPSRIQESPSGVLRIPTNVTVEKTNSATMAIENSPRTLEPLQTISEAEIEIDVLPSGSNKPGKMRPAEYTPASVDFKTSGEVQTSETRMIRATDLQKMNANLDRRS